jgi:hypothetical protein
MIMLLGRVVLVGLLSLAAMTAIGATSQPDEASLRAADAEELRIIVECDVTAEREFMHPNYLVNSPANRVVRKDELIKLLSEGKIANDAIKRTIEATAITGNIGIVMGSETITPKPTSELGQLYGEKPLARRFTDVFLFEGGKWRLLARQSTVIQGRAER